MSFDSSIATDAPTRESILLEAERIVGGDRQADYGDSNANLDRIAQFATLLGVPIDGAGVAKVLMSVKLARHQHRAKRDNLVDLAGYAELLARRQGL